MLTVSCSLRAKNPNKDKGASEVTTSVTVKPVKRCRKKKKSPSALAGSRKRYTYFLEKKLAGKPGEASPEGKSVTAVPSEQDTDNSLCAKELENTSLTCGRRSNSNLVSTENPTPASESDFDKQATLLEFLDTTDSDDDVSSVPVHSVCSNCKHPPKEKKDLICCSHCQITRYCSIQCQRKFHRFACSVVGKQSDSCESLNSLPQGPVYIGVLKQFYNISTPHVHGFYYSHCGSDCVFLTF